MKNKKLCVSLPYLMILIRKHLFYEFSPVEISKPRWLSKCNQTFAF